MYATGKQRERIVAGRTVGAALAMVASLPTVVQGPSASSKEPLPGRWCEALLLTMPRSQLEAHPLCRSVCELADECGRVGVG